MVKFTKQFFIGVYLLRHLSNSTDFLTSYVIIYYLTIIMKKLLECLFYLLPPSKFAVPYLISILLDPKCWHYVCLNYGVVIFHFSASLMPLFLSLRVPKFVSTSACIRKSPLILVKKTPLLSSRDSQEKMLPRNKSFELLL